MKDWIFSEVTREERFFTSVLHHELMNNIDPFSRMLCSRLNLGSHIHISDFGYEVCFFRDWARRGLIERQRELEKQTFDFMVRLSDGSAAIIEAKAQQGYANKQLNDLIKAKTIIEERKALKISKIYLVALCSSTYRMKEETKQLFKAIIFWDRLNGVEGLTDTYPGSSVIFKRANEIYGK